MTRVIILNIFVLLTLFNGISGREYLQERPEFLEICSTKDPDFNNCYKGNLQALLSQYKDGIPGMGINGIFEPVIVKKLKIIQQQLKLELKNLTIYGVSGTNITKIKHNPKDFSFRVRARIPDLRVVSRYRTDGNVLFLPINGKGNLHLHAENIDIVLLFKMRLQDDGNFTYADMQAVRSRLINIESFQVQLENLFNGNQVLEQYMNEFLNEMWRDIVEVLRPTLEESMDTLLLARFKLIFDYIPANYFINDVPKAKEFYNTTTVL